MSEGTYSTLGTQLVEARVGRPIADYLREAYVVRQLPQADIAVALGVNTSTVSRWMRQLGIEARVIGHKKRRAVA